MQTVTGRCRYSLKSALDSLKKSCTLLAVCAVPVMITLLVQPADAGVPCAATSSREMKIGGTVCADADAVFGWQGNKGTIDIRVTVRDCASQPVEGSNVRLDFLVAGDPTDELPPSVEIRINIDSELTGTTDAQGVAVWEVILGGCGRAQIDWRATADGVDLGTDSQTYCFRSHDMNGDGIVNFQDVFLYLPFSFSGTGWAGNFNCVQPVNFFDIIGFLPDLNAAAHADVSTVAVPAALGECAP